MSSLPCHYCGTVKDVSHTYEQALWDLYYRRKDEKHRISPLVFTQEDVEDDPEWYDDRENSGTWLAMERNMADRGLCPACGLPDLRGLSDDDFHTHEDMKELQEMWAEQEAERRMGA